MFKPLDTILPILQTTTVRWKTLCQALPQDLLSRKPAEDAWSALDCLIHLIDTERNIFPVRVKAFLMEMDFPAFDPDKEGTSRASSTPADLAAEFTTLRVRSLRLLKSLGAHDLARTAQHPELGQVTLEQLLQEWAGHDLNHTIQAEQALMQTFISGCGPWRMYFTSHDIALK